MESPTTHQHHDADVDTRRQNGTLSSSCFVRQHHPFFVEQSTASCHPRRPSRPRLIHETSLDEVLGAGHDQLEGQFHRTLLRVERMMRSNDARAAERDRQVTVRAEWQLVATVVDRILLVIFVATTVGVTMVTRRQTGHRLTTVRQHSASQWWYCLVLLTRSTSCWVQDLLTPPQWTPSEHLLIMTPP